MRMNLIKTGYFAALVCVATIACGGRAFAQQTSSGPVAARIKCQGGDWVNVTADAEQGLPLQIVDKANCNEIVTVLSDPLGYTVKIRTSSGKVGYVTRYEVVVDPNAQPKLAPIIVMKGGNQAPPQTPASPTPQTSVQEHAASAAASNAVPDDKGPRKPRVYISDTQSWTETGGFSNPPPGQQPLYAGYNPEMPDIYQSFTSDCASVTVTQDKADADYAVLFDKGSSKKGVSGLGGLVKVNKVVVLSRSGETIASEESRSADFAMRAACSAIAQRSTASGGTQTGKPQ